MAPALFLLLLLSLAYGTGAADLELAPPTLKLFSLANSAVTVSIRMPNAQQFSQLSSTAGTTLSGT
jgi:hypothetical protein